MMMVRYTKYIRQDKELPICIDIGGQIISRDMTVTIEMV